MSQYPVDLPTNILSVLQLSKCINAREGRECAVMLYMSPGYVTAGA
jgi:hypothetical protein